MPRALPFLLVAAVLAGCGGASVKSLGDKMAASDQNVSSQEAPAVRYEQAFADLMVWCSDSPSDVEGAIDTDAGFLTAKGFPGGESDWQFMASLKHLVGGGPQVKCSDKAALLVQSSGVSVP